MRVTHPAGAGRSTWKQQIIARLPERARRAVLSLLGIGTFWQDFEDHLSRLIGEVRRSTGEVVQDGPFRGMILTGDQSWGDFGSKLLGTYESELFPSIEDIGSRHPRYIVNVGSAEGYYAIGLARISPTATVAAFDISADAQEATKTNALKNKVDDRVDIHGICTVERLRQILTDWASVVLVLDCEGAEMDLIPPCIDLMGESCLLVECHDQIVPGAASELRRLLEPTHHVETIDQGPRNPHRIRHIRHWGESDRWIILSERRSVPMQWLYAVPKAARA